MKQFTFLQEGSNSIFIQVQKSSWSCTQVNSCQYYTLYINTYFIDYFIQGIIKNPRINEVLYLHQKLQTKQFL